jgi:hypothetical protein
MPETINDIDWGARLLFFLSCAAVYGDGYFFFFFASSKL